MEGMGALQSALFVVTFGILPLTLVYTHFPAWAHAFDVYGEHSVALGDATPVQEAIEALREAVGTVFVWGPVAVVSSMRFSTADVCGSAMACYAYRVNTFEGRGKAGRRKYVVESLVACVILQFGGTTLTGLALGQSPSWLTSHRAFPALLLCFALTFFAPLDLWFRVMHAPYSPLRAVMQAGAWLATGHAVSSWGVDKALGADHTKANVSPLACLVSGTLSACGGGIIGDALGVHETAWGLNATPKALTAPTLTLVKAFLGAVLYWGLRDPQHVLRDGVGGHYTGWPLEAGDARGAVAVFMYAIALVDFFFPQIFGTVSCVCNVCAVWLSLHRVLAGTSYEPLIRVFGLTRTMRVHPVAVRVRLCLAPP